MDTTELKVLFDVKYGNKFDANKMTFAENGDINFISRDSNNNGCVGTVKQYGDKVPYPDGLITVSLGGSFLLSSFLQPKKFYTAQNVAVLIPKKLMTVAEKLYYCECISMNRFKYSAFGREANKSLKHLKIPIHVPEWVSEYNNISEMKLNLNKSVNSLDCSLNDRNWKWFKFQNLFTIQRGESEYKYTFRKGIYPYISATSDNNGVSYWCDRFNNEGNKITVSYDGSVGEAFYQPHCFFASEKIAILGLLNYPLNVYIALFLIPIIRLEKFRYNYGIKWAIESRMKQTKIKLPTDNNGEPDWQFMEDYIKSLPYSSNL